MNKKQKAELADAYFKFKAEIDKLKKKQDAVKEQLRKELTESKQLFGRYEGNLATTERRTANWESMLEAGIDIDEHSRVSVVERFNLRIIK